MRVSASNTSNNGDPNLPSNSQTRRYTIDKRIFWVITAAGVAIFIVLLALTIYFGVNQKKSDSSEMSTTNEARSTTSESTMFTSTLTSTTTLSPPVERVPNTLKPDNYHITIEPNLTTETFSGRNYFSITMQTNDFV